jgi:DNA-binding NtrC family response regulator
MQQIMQLPAAPTSVLICGEAGTQKEFIARTIHNAATTAPFVTVDCRAFADGDLWKNFFARICKRFSQSAHTGLPPGGTLFLDIIEKLSTSAQHSLLRGLVAETKDSLPCGIRLMAASNMEPEQLLRLGLFSKPLLKMLAGHVIEVSPLRERPQDILSVAESFRDQANIELRKSVRNFCTETQQILLEHSWPGNYPELWYVIYRATVTAQDAVDPEYLRELLREKKTGATHASDNLLNQIIRAQTQSAEYTLAQGQQRLGPKKRSLASRLLGLGKWRRNPFNKPNASN